MFSQELQMWLYINPIWSTSIWQIGLLPFVKESGNLNAECTVFPPVSSVAAILDKAMDTASLLSDLTLSRIKLITNVFPVSPGSSNYIKSSHWFSTQSSMA